MASAPTQLAVRNGASPSLPARVEAVSNAMETLKALRTFVVNEFTKDVDFGVIPGTSKPTLYLPGAQKITMYFNVRPRFKIRHREIGAEEYGHVEYVLTCELYTRGTKELVSEGVGSCSTMEKKYRFIKSGRACPSCGSPSLMKSKFDKRGGWYCNAKAGGCGMNFRADDPDITDQATGQVESPNVWDQRNTVLKMAKKRSLVDATLNLGGLSEKFTQDLEDIYDVGAAAHQEAPAAAPDPREAVKEAPAAKAPTRAAAPPKQAPPTRSTGWSRFASEAIAEANSQYRAELEDLGMVPADLTDYFRVTHHLITAAIEYTDGSGEVRPLIDPASVGLPNDPTKRDGKKAYEAAGWLYGQGGDWQAWAEETTRDYLAAKLKAARVKLGTDDPEGPELDGFQDMPREPGSDG